MPGRVNLAVIIYLRRWNAVLDAPPANVPVAPTAQACLTAHDAPVILSPAPIVASL